MNTEPLTRPRRLRWPLIAVTLSVAWLGGSLAWWYSPTGVEWRRMREAQRWIDNIPYWSLSDMRMAKLRFHASTSEEIWVTGTDVSPEAIKALEETVKYHTPPCAVRLMNVVDTNGDALESRYLYSPAE